MWIVTSISDNQACNQASPHVGLGPNYCSYYWVWLENFFYHSTWNRISNSLRIVSEWIFLIKRWSLCPSCAIYCCSQPQQFMALATVAVACYCCSCSYRNLFRTPIIEQSYKHNLIISVMLLLRSTNYIDINKFPPWQIHYHLPSWELLVWINLELQHYLCRLAH